VETKSSRRIPARNPAKVSGLRFQVSIFKTPPSGGVFF
jgi:hypothetical protein